MSSKRKQCKINNSFPSLIERILFELMKHVFLWRKWNYIDYKEIIDNNNENYKNESFSKIKIDCL